MWLMTAVAITAVAAGGLTAKTGGRAVREITVCLDRGTPVTSDASRGVSRAFRYIDVKVNWEYPATCRTAAGAIQIDLAYNTPGGVHPGSLAYALPYEGTHIVILMDRVESAVRCDKCGNLLIYVLLHEITHILQGIARHSQSGIMKAHWNQADEFEIGRGTLSFTDEDVELIYWGIDARRARGPRSPFVASAQ